MNNLIDTEGLDEQLRCEMCRNPMHTDRGCDGNCKYDEKLYESIMQILDERMKPLPSAQPERKKGKWIYGEHDVAMCDGYRCNKCGFFVPWDYKHKSIDYIKDYHFCPNCGTKMENYGGETG